MWLNKMKMWLNENRSVAEKTLYLLPLFTDRLDHHRQHCLHVIKHLEFELSPPSEHHYFATSGMTTTTLTDASEGTLLQLQHPIAVSFLHHGSLEIEVVRIAATIAGFHVRRLQNHTVGEGEHVVVASPASPRPSVPRAMCRSGCRRRFHRL